MQLSTTATAYILLNAYTNSEWDECNFAIVQVTPKQKRAWARRLEVVEHLKDDWNFQSLNYYDTAVNFYRIDKNEQPNIDKFLAEKQWVYVTLDKDERQTFAAPESRLGCCKFVILSNGNAYYQAHGKHTGEEFYSEEFSLHQLINN
jgi:hypothetical protein